MLANTLPRAAALRQLPPCTCWRAVGQLASRPIPSRTFSAVAPRLTRPRPLARPAPRQEPRRGYAARPKPTEPLVIDGTSYPRDAFTNATPTILDKLPRRLHLQPSHPIGILRSLIESHFSTFEHLNSLSPIVTVAQNFDDLGFPADHPGRALTDSYYLNEHHMLRTHTSAHEVEQFRKGLDQFLVTADVYRRDEIDRSHYPVFHQMEGCNVVDPAQGGIERLERENAEMRAALGAANIVIEDLTGVETATNPYQTEHDPRTARIIAEHLKNSLNGLVLKLFGGRAGGDGAEPLRVRWIEATFPWTAPSYEVEVMFNGKWLEILGCGVVRQAALEKSGASLSLSLLEDPRTPSAQTLTPPSFSLLAFLLSSPTPSSVLAHLRRPPLASTVPLDPLAHSLVQASGTSRGGRSASASSASPWSSSRSPTSASSGRPTRGSATSSARATSRRSSPTRGSPSATRTSRSGSPRRAAPTRCSRGTRTTSWSLCATRRATWWRACSWCVSTTRSSLSRSRSAGRLFLEPTPGLG